MLLIMTNPGDELCKRINIDDFERPWISKIRGFSKKKLWFRAATHILRVSCAKKAGDRPRQPEHKIFSIKHRFQQSNSRPFRFKEVGARGRQIGVPPQKWLFYRYPLV